MHLFQGLIGNASALHPRYQSACHGFTVGKKAPLSDKKVTVGNHDFVDVGTGVISMDLVVLGMKERGSCFVPKVFSACVQTGPSTGQIVRRTFSLRRAGRDSGHLTPVNTELTFKSAHSFISFLMTQRVSLLRQSRST